MDEKTLTEIVLHDGDCSIYESDICDCGALRRIYSQLPYDAALNERWARHEAAIERLKLAGKAVGTPRTDALRAMINADCLSDDASTWYEHACQLERELYAANSKQKE